MNWSTSLPEYSSPWKPHLALIQLLYYILLILVYLSRQDLQWSTSTSRSNFLFIKPGSNEDESRWELAGENLHECFLNSRCSIKPAVRVEWELTRVFFRLPCIFSLLPRFFFFLFASTLLSNVSAMLSAESRWLADRREDRLCLVTATSSGVTQILLRSSPGTAELCR